MIFCSVMTFANLMPNILNRLKALIKRGGEIRFSDV